MSLYHEAAEILNRAQTQGGSLKMHIFSPASAPGNNNKAAKTAKTPPTKSNSSKTKAKPLKTTPPNDPKPWKSDPKTLYALTTSASKLSSLLAPIIEASQLLHHEKHSLSPLLALLVVHDLLFAKRGIALPETHGLAKAVTRHRVRLVAELGRARVRAGKADVRGLREAVEREAEARGAGGLGGLRVRWVRVNALRSSLARELGGEGGEFAGWEVVPGLEGLAGKGGRRVVFVDPNVRDLVAVPEGVDLAGTRGYREGRLVLQDKASCFPAALLDQPAGGGDVIDACAAPGNKTTHLAALGWEKAERASVPMGLVFACEKDALRSKTLEKMTRLACGSERKDCVVLKTNQNFMKLDPHAKEFASVTALLLDPSCSGSGIVGRDETSLKLQVPQLPSQQAVAANGTSKKRKRSQPEPAAKAATVSVAAGSGSAEGEEGEEEEEATSTTDQAALATRLIALADFQLRLLLHAMSFPHAKRIAYSTCSVHAEENEGVVVKALKSEVARSRGWRVLRREEQVEGIGKWRIRGDGVAVESRMKEEGLEGFGVQEIAEACVRCVKGSEDATMGFFVCGFVRDVEGGDEPFVSGQANGIHAEQDDDDDDEEEWGGFSDGE
ncbi:hypothetical protein MBLNU230_g7396t1 [Neophaeotheca triangularis]